MKRRNGECAKLRRPIKRNKITDGIYGSTVLYLKFFVLWALVLLADFLLEFRFEFLWPFWLLLRSVYDSYKYQGLAFSVFFVSIALTSDMICYFFIPVQWLFFAASTYVWVQYVWHTEKGICLPTVVLWLLFAYMEAAVRLRDLRHMPFHLDLCRPFAAHCIGYPVVTLGFGFKSYVSYRIRQRRQRDVRKENGFYMNLLSQALPIEAVQNPGMPGPDKSKAGSGTLTEATSNGVAHGPGVSHSHCNSTSSKGSSHRKSLDKGEKSTEGYANGTVHHTEIEFTERPRTLTEVDEPEVEKEKTTTTTGTTTTRSRKEGKGNQWNTGNHREGGGGGGGGFSGQRRRGNREQAHQESQPHRDDYYLRLEADVKRLRNELQSSKQNEHELRAQVNSLVASEKLAKLEVSSLQQHNDELVNKVQSLSSQRHNEKSTISMLERRLGEERRMRASLEAQLSAERKARAALTAAAAAASSNNANRGECTEACRGRRRELESEVKQLRRELKIKEERCANIDRELQSLLQYKDSHNEAEILMQALSALQDKNTHLENSLSAETRIKLDLFSALGEAKRLLEIRESVIRAQERELEELKGKMAQVLAVMPTDFGAVTTCSKLRLGGGMGLAGTSVEATAAASALDPNASVYTPKQGHLTTEA